MTIKQRVRSRLDKDRYDSVDLSYATPTSENRSYSLMDEVQKVTTEGHPVGLLGDHRVSMDIGGPFQSEKVWFELDNWEEWGSRANYSPTLGWAYTTVSIPTPSTDFASIGSRVDNGTFNNTSAIGSYASTQAPDAVSDSYLDSRGSTFISRVLPTSPVVDLAVSIGEFASERKFFSLPGSSGSLPGEYLNYMFGVAPTLAMVQDLRFAIENQDKILSQYERDSGRRIRRRYGPEVTTSVSKTVQNSTPCHAIGATYNTFQHGITLGRRTTVTTTKVSEWFSGAFTYYLPKDGWRRTLAELDKLYGVKPGSSLIWELVPYSWLVDYRTNVGDVLKNLDAFSSDGLVMPYGYIMRTELVSSEYTWQGRLTDWSGVPVDKTVTGRLYKETKQRRAATPFGFGVDPGTFSARQLSIIAALGLTKLDK